MNLITFLNIPKRIAALILCDIGWLLVSMSETIACWTHEPLFWLYILSAIGIYAALLQDNWTITILIFLLTCVIRKRTRLQ